MAIIQHDITGVILVGGQSRRMGRDKAFLCWQGAPLFETVLSVFRESFATTCLVGREEAQYARYGLKFLADIYPGSALGGLYTGLFHAATEHVFVSACDMPYPNRGLLRHLCSLKAGYDCVVAQTAEALEPLFAVYAKSALPAMQTLLERGNFRVYDLYPMLRTRYVTVEELAPFADQGRSFINVNTPEEFARLQDHHHK
ncbi:molybdenum cofactor guanylyltransferase [Geomonas sp.]|uniref:molybdenum cofactor guanylyltransferase n=1 Tax=Geomonas sp. TaxID=2651584 RepID=UPI002B49530E|nr:molybdenum cofactor guanylyltransferase [Geomonas sp.]HJV36977.1 molybdenum cofactor guanylyltransferase [Geomonas sp.]